MLVRTTELQWSSHVRHGRNFSCPGERVVFTCTLNSIAHSWNSYHPSNPVLVSVIPQALNPISPNMNYTFDGSVNGNVLVTTATVIATPSLMRSYYQHIFSLFKQNFWVSA